MDNEIPPPDCLNTSEFMWHVTMHTPQVLRQVNGIVSVDAHVRIDAAGHVTVKSVTCRTMNGRAIAPDNAEVVAAARAALVLLRFAPARDADGNAVPFEDYSLSFGYTTAALEMRASDADRIRCQSSKN
jgi:hypothetical protein